MIKYHKTKSLKRVPWYHSTLAAILTAVLIAGIVFLRIFQPYERLSQVFIPIGAFVYYGFSVLVYPALFYVTLKGLYEYQHYKANTSSANISPYSLRFYTFVFFLIALVAGLIFFITAPVWFDSALVIEGEISSKPNLIAHRGLVSDAPENTIPAFEKALQAGAWGISSKVYFSLDKVAFLHHDSTFMRTTNIENIFPDRVNDYCGGFNYTDIQKLEAGSWFDSSFNGTAIPTFNEVLLLIKKYPGTFFIFDIFPPATNHPAYTTYAKAMRDQIIAAGVASQIMFNGRDPQWIKENPIPSLQYNSENLEVRDGPEYNLKYYLSRGRNTINAQWTLSNSRLKPYLAHPNLTVGIWVVDEPYLFEQFWCLGVNYVMTNKLQIMQQFNNPKCFSKNTWPSLWIILGITTVVVLILESLVIFFIWKRKQASKIK